MPFVKSTETGDSTALSITGFTVNDGDWMLLVMISTEDAFTVTPPTGFAIVLERAATIKGEVGFFIYKRKADGETGDFSWSASRDWNSCTMLVYTDVEDVGIVGTWSEAASGNAIANSIDPTGSCDLLMIAGVDSKDTQAWTPDAGMIKRVDYQSTTTGGRGCLLVADEESLGAPTGTRTAIPAIADKPVASILLELTNITAPGDSLFGTEF